MPFVFNAVRTFGNPLRDGVKAHKVVLEVENLEREEKQRLARIINRKLEKETDGVGAVVEEDGTIVIYLVSRKEPKIDGKLEAESRGIGYSLKASYKGTVLLSAKRYWIMENLLRQIIRKRILERGYTESFSQGKFYGGIPKFFIVGKFQEPVYVYEGFRIKPKVFADGSVLVFLEPKTTWRINLYEYIKILRARGVEDKEILDFIINGRPKRKVKLGPFGFSGLIIDIAFDESVDKIKVNEQTIRERWLRKYGIKIPEDDFIVYVDMDKQPFAYPSSQVFLSTKEMPFSEDQRRIFLLSPRRKKEKTLLLLKTLLEEPLDLGEIKLCFDTYKLVDLDNLKKENKIVEYGRLELPALRFTGDFIGKNPIDIKKSGPFSGQKSINVLYVVPDAFENLIIPFHNILNSAFQELKLGKLIRKDIIKIEGKPIGMAYRQIATQAVERMKNCQGQRVLIILLPGRGLQKFDFIKGASVKQIEGSKNFQFITINTVQRIITKSDRGIAYNMALHLYLKAMDLNKGEAPWILLKPAGNVGGTAYAAYDVSREISRDYDPRTRRVIVERKEAAARAALCDCYGLTIRMRSKISPVGEALTRETVTSLLFDLISDGKESLKRFNEDLRRLVLFKDGEVRINERTIIEKSFEEIRQVTPEVSFEVFSVIKGVIERVYTDEGNPPVGFYVIFDERSALLFSSDVSFQRDKLSGEERVPVSPLLLRYELAIPNKMFSVAVILKEFFDLSRLHWNSIYFKTKTSLPLQLVQKIGDYSRREIVIPQDISYLPV
jgi:hypothetical protein